MFLSYPIEIFAQTNITETQKNEIAELEQKADDALAAKQYGTAFTYYSKIAETYEKFQDFHQSETYYKKALTAAKQQKSKFRISSAYFHLINVLKKDKKWSEALSFESERLKLIQSQGNKKAYANALIDMAFLLKKTKRYDEAIRKLEEALKISLFELKNETMTLHCYMELANNYKLLGNEEKYNEYNSLVERIKNEKTTSELKNKTKEAEIKAKEKEQELKETSSKLNEVSDSLDVVKEALTKAELIARNKELELQAKNAKIKQQEAELKLQRVINYFLIVIVILVALAAFLWYVQYRKKRDALHIVQLQKEEILQKKEEIQVQAEELEFQRDELYKSNKTKEKLLSVVAHDLKNPIHALIGFSELLVDDESKLSDEEEKQYIEYIHESSVQIHNLLENLLKWAQSQSSSIKYQPEQFDVNELLNVNIKLFNESGLKKRINLVFKNSGNKTVFADKNMINTVIRNLVNNAIKFTAAGGSVTVASETKNDEVEITVADTGVGMSEEAVKKILETDEFHSSLGTFNEQGTGLGLAICKEFLHVHKSKLEIESRIGKGSKFYFRLPVKSNVSE